MRAMHAMIRDTALWRAPGSGTTAFRRDERPSDCGLHNAKTISRFGGTTPGGGYEGCAQTLSRCLEALIPALC